MKTITNLTNSPFDLQGTKGVVRLPAFGSVDGEFSGEYLGLLEASMAVRVEDAAPAEPEPSAAPSVQPAESSLEDAQAQYEALAGKPADKRWSEKRLAEEIAKLQKA